jgi:hypothetical protein
MIFAKIIPYPIPYLFLIYGNDGHPRMANILNTNEILCYAQATEFKNCNFSLLGNVLSRP